MAEVETKEEYRDVLQSLLAILHAEDEDHEQIEDFLEEMHPQEIAHLLESLPSSDRQVVWEHVPADSEGEILVHLADDVRSAIMDRMDTDQLVAATESLDTDDLADLLPEMPRDIVQEILLSMEQQERERLRSVLSYSEDSAGGLMDLDMITVRADTNLDVVLRYLRRRGSIPESTDSLFVVDREGRFQGLLPLTVILTSDPEMSVAEIMEHDVIGIPVDMPARDVANLFERRDLITAPVIAEDGQLMGRITIDDVVDVIPEEADHSLMSMAGLNEEEDMFAPVITSTRRRSIWLGINLLTALLAAWVIGLFEGTIEQLVALAVLMPIVASMGGIAGSQTLTLVIRGMALGKISATNAKTILRKEFGVGIWNGVIWAIIIASVAGFWFDSFKLSLVIAAAILINLIMAAISGAVIPLLLKKMGGDPALSGSVILTTVTDVVGFFAFLGLATLFLI